VERPTVQVDFTSEEVEVVRRTLQGRMNEMFMEIANTDARDYRAMLVEEEGLLQGIMAKLGCVHQEGSLEAGCSDGP
jgi:hypothetical protein